MRDPSDALVNFMQGLATVDCHEHLPAERERIETQVDVLTLLSVYPWLDMHSAGRPSREGETWAEGNICRDTSVPLQERWREIWPYLQRVKHGSYYRATRIALRDIYGVDDLNAETYVEASRRIAEANRPGLYKRVLRDLCGIRTCLIQTGAPDAWSTSEPRGLYTLTLPIAPWYRFAPIEWITDLHVRAGQRVSTLDTYLELLAAHLTKARADGAVVLKMGTERYVPPDVGIARQAFGDAVSGAPPDPVLKATVLDFILQRAAQWDMPVAIHTGVWDVVGMNPKLTIDFIEHHRGVRFELYHLGIPSARDCTFIAKGYPNVFLNLSWCYIGSQEITRRAIGEIIDAVPVNKVFAFGGDHNLDVENVYGHLVMARETLAQALSDRIGRGQLDLNGAKEIAGLWLHDNPSEFYRLPPTPIQR